MSEEQESFDLGPPRDSARDEETLNVSLDGWEGPLDLLLLLARQQKVDLAKISILRLVEQYLAFIEGARALRLEVAADYLVMAAWLAYLKSCLLLPKEEQEEPSAEELALRLQMRLQRLEAMREAGARLMGRDRIGRDVFLRGRPEGLRVVRKAEWDVSLYEVISAYGAVQIRNRPAVHVVQRRPVLSLEDAIDRLEALLQTRIEWTALERFLPETADPDYRRSALASSFVAALELARQGKVVLDQRASFGPLYLRPA